MGTPRLLIRPGNPDFLDLPWDQPVNDWVHERLVEMPTGIHRHPVVFVAYDEGVFVNSVVPPATTPGRCLIRTSYMATHTDEMLDRVLGVIEKAGKKLGVI